MRRIHIAGILALLVLSMTAGIASAHPGLEDPYVPLGRTANVVMGVPSEDQTAMIEVDITLPAIFALQRVDPTPGWQSSASSGLLKFTGNAPPGQYVQFDFAGVFNKKTFVEFPVLTHAADGTVHNWAGSPTASYPAAIACPGYARGSCPIPGVSASSGGRNLLVWAGRILVVAGAIVVSALLIARRRRGQVAS